MTPLPFRFEDAAHNHRVGELSLRLAVRYGLGPTAALRIGAAATLHDIGKIDVPQSILAKPGPLTSGEWLLVRRHTIYGAAILTERGMPCGGTCVDIARSHHEWWDGSGYPDGLAGEAIPLEARIAAVADVFDALTHDRPCRSALPAHAALELIRELSGCQFDPRVVEAFESLARVGVDTAWSLPQLRARPALAS